MVGYGLAFGSYVLLQQRAFGDYRPFDIQLQKVATVDRDLGLLIVILKLLSTFV